jgi:lipopolysaccharide biosynthesis glycosyltransferase
MSNIVITAANNVYYETLVTLVASIHRTSYDVVDKIYVYDLGLDQSEIDRINSFDKCEVLDLPNLLGELPFEDYLKPKGHAYKCFCLYDSKKLGDNILWLDAGVMVLQSLSVMFDTIENEGIFCVGDSHLNKNFTRPECVKIMEATESEMNDVQLSSGIIGYKTNGKHVHIFDEAFEYSKIEGCVVGDDNNHRHDQSVYSILISRYGIRKHDIDVYGYWTDINRNLETAKNNNAVIFVHRRGHHDTNGLKYKNEKN